MPPLFNVDEYLLKKRRSIDNSQFCYLHYLLGKYFMLQKDAKKEVNSNVANPKWGIYDSAINGCARWTGQMT